MMLKKIERIHQILIVDGLGEAKKIPTELSIRMDNLKNTYPDAFYKLWAGDELRSCIESRFDKDVLDAFDSLRPYSYKADLGRFCLLFAFGGLYSDVSIQSRSAWGIPDQFGIAAFKECWPWHGYVDSMCTSFMWSASGRHELEIAINKIVSNVKHKYYGVHASEPTGPWLLGRSFAAAATDRWRAGEVDDQYIGVVSLKAPGEPALFLAKETEPTVIASRPKRVIGDWSKSGMVGVNSYTAMWRDGDVYQ